MYLRVSILLSAGAFVAGASLVSAQLREQPTPDVTDKALITNKPHKIASDLSATPAIQDVKQYTIEQFMDTTRVGGGSFSHDGRRILFHSNKSGIFNVYSMPIAGGKPKQLTDSKKESTYAVSFFPSDDRFLFRQDKGGNENDHLFLQTPDGKVRDLTPGEKTKASFLKWAHDRKSFFFSTNERDPKFFDVYEMPLDRLEPTLIYKNEAGFEFGDISNDERYIAFGKPGESTADSDVYLYDRKTSEMKNVTPHEGEVGNQPETFGPDSKHLYFTSNEGAEFYYLVRLDLESGERQTIERTDWDISAMNFSRTGRYQVLATNEDARTKIRIRDEKTGEPLQLPDLPDGDISNVRFSDAEDQLLFTHTGSRSPNNLFVFEIPRRRLQKLTDTLSPAINPDDLVDGRVVRYTSFDGMEIPAILYKPHQASASAKVPAIVNVHGGPGGQARMPYNPLLQYLVNHGYAVLDVNNRGSSGYGRTFFTADDGKHGREPLWDCVEAKKYLGSLDYVDAEKIAIMGGSYGGYMVLAALAFQPEAFSAGIDIFGVANWVRTLQSIPPYWESARKSLYKEIGNPETQLDMLRETSPLFHADKITKPLLVLQGANDPRVLKAESDDMVEAIKKRNGVVEYIVFDNEGHGFRKKENELRAYKAVLQFLDKHLKGAAASES